MSREIILTLVGNPNCGKSMLFNALTNESQHVGNWSGVTVDKKSGICALASQKVTVIDLPGIQTLHHYPEEQAIDTHISCDVLASGEADMCLNVLDACSLEKGLALTQQLCRSASPMIVVINKYDLAMKQGLSIDADLLSKELQCPVICISAKNKHDIATLRKLIDNTLNSLEQKTPTRKHDEELLRAEKYLTSMIESNTGTSAKRARDIAERLLCGADVTATPLTNELLKQCQQIIQEASLADPVISYCKTDFSEARRLCTLSTTQQKATKSFSERLDNVLLNRWVGIPFFFLMMYLLFFFAINVGGAFQDAFEWLGDALFVRLPTQWLIHWHAPGWLVAILTDGIGKGLSTTITFIPVIAALFFFLSLLQETGYLARAAFVIDRVMQALRLPGQAFIPMIIGFGCNVPAVLGTRSLNHTSDRIITSLMTPFMSCGARLAIFAVFANAFFTHGGSFMVFLLYLIGLVIAILTALLVRRLMLHSYQSHWLVSLPNYQRPHLKNIVKRIKQRVMSFVKRSGRIIVPTCAIIGALTQVNISFTQGIHTTTPNHSALAKIGKTITPVFTPMGIHQDNWPATVGLITGVMAKEVVIATLNTLYESKHDESLEHIHWSTELKEAGQSIVNKLAELPKALINPILASAPDQSMTHNAYARMQAAFSDRIQAFCYLLFVLLYFPCISTLAVMRQELGRWWGNFSMLWSTVIAYVIATNTYQVSTWASHPLSSSIWLGSSILVLGSFAVLAHRNAAKLKASTATKHPQWKSDGCQLRCKGCDEGCGDK